MFPRAAKAGLTIIAKKIRGHPLQRPPNRNTHTRCLRRLEDLPFELLEYIFRLACADGGKTGCSLSLVSRHIRAASRSSRFNSVALRYGVRSQLDQFVATYERVCEEAVMQDAPRPHVRHMALVLIVDVEKYPEEERRIVVSSDIVLYDGPCVLAQEYREGIARLFQRVSTAHLESLLLLGCDMTVHRVEEHCVFCQPIACPDGFPKLRELSLTVGGNIPFVHGANPDRGGNGTPSQDSKPLFPALKRLYMWLEHGTEMDLESWATRTPRLEALEVTVRCHAQQEIMFLPGFLSVLTKTHFNDSAGMPTSKPLWPELKQVAFTYLAQLVRNELPADREAYIHFVDELNAFKDVLPKPRLMEFTPSYRLRDENEADVGLSSLVDRWEAARGYAFTYVNWVIRSRGGPTVATPDYGSDFWDPEAMVQAAQGSNVMSGIAKKLRSVFGKDTRDVGNGVFWWQ
ncbi:hypothetical protein C8Q70DRAFT_1055260 [Cubamyces menziesii]|nr:hypothetical protein C8Q70DRAFT_1055260 [Cubamyces menziesii]